MVENNYDIPHRRFVEPEITAMLTALTDLVIRNTNLPVGINVLWNDYRSALGICAATGARFFRILAFVDSVKTRYGKMPRVAKKAIAYRKRLGLEKIAIFADVHVKHAEMVCPKKPLFLLVKQAFTEGAEAVIITGRWTGDAPKMDDLRIAREVAGKRPLLVGGGSIPENLKSFFKYADGIIVGTAIMENKKVNSRKLKKYMETYDEEIFAKNYY